MRLSPLNRSANPPTWRRHALKPRHVAACVAGAKRRDIGDVAGREPAAERAVSDKADAQFVTEQQNFSLDVAGQQ